MATLVLRTVKGSPLTNAEVDGNFSNINSEVAVVNSNVGILSNLTTSAKSNLVAAINEIASESTTNVTITGGTVSGTVITNSTWNGNVIAVAYGGTGSSTTTDARNSLGLGSANTVTFATVNQTAGQTVNYTVTDTLSGNVYTGNTYSGTTGTFSGVVTALDFNSTSDITLKENLRPINNPLDIISKINGFEFTWKNSGETAYGFSAQEVEKIIPAVVKQRDDGNKGINYLNLIAFLVEAVKDLKKEVQELKNR